MKKTVLVVLVLLLLSLTSTTGSGTAGEAADITFVPLSPEAYKMTLSPDKKLLYVVGSSGNLDVVNIETRTLERTIRVSYMASGICVNKFFGIVLPSIIIGGSPIGSNRVFILDPMDYTVNTSFYPGLIITTVCAFNAEGDHIYFAANSTLYAEAGVDKISVVDNEPRIRKWIKDGSPGAPSDIALVPGEAGEEKFFLTLGNTGLHQGWVGVVRNDAVEKHIPLPIIPGKITFSPDGKLAYIPGWDRKSPSEYSGVAVVDVETEELIDFLQIGSSPQVVKFLPDDGRYAYALYYTGLWVFDFGQIGQKGKTVQTVRIFQTPYKYPEWYNVDFEILPQGEDGVLLIFLQPTRVGFLETKRVGVQQ